MLAVLGSTFVVFLIEAALIIVLRPAALLGRRSRTGCSRCSSCCASARRAFAAMGLGITALVRSAEGSSAVINAIYLPMAIISGHVLHAERLPASSCA